MSTDDAREQLIRHYVVGQRQGRAVRRGRTMDCDWPAAPPLTPKAGCWASPPPLRAETASPPPSTASPTECLPCECGYLPLLPATSAGRPPRKGQAHRKPELHHRHRADGARAAARAVWHPAGHHVHVSTSLLSTLPLPRHPSRRTCLCVGVCSSSSVRHVCCPRARGAPPPPPPPPPPCPPPAPPPSAFRQH